MVNVSSRPRGTDPARSSPWLSRLSLAEVRQYRAMLASEESRTGYWCRLVKSRIRVLAGRRGGEVPRLRRDTLTRALGSTGTGARRAVLGAIRENGGLPDLPDLSGQWVAAAAVGQGDWEVVLVASREALERLTVYQAVVKQRHAEATSELIARYRDDPSACLDLVR